MSKLAASLTTDVLLVTKSLCLKWSPLKSTTVMRARVAGSFMNSVRNVVVSYFDRAASA